MKHSFIFFPAIFLLFISACSDGREPDRGSSNLPPAFDLISFVDLDVRPSFGNANLERVSRIASSVKKAFLSENTVRRFSINIYPIFYATGSLNPVFSFKNAESDRLSRLERINLLQSYKIKSQYQYFSDRYMQDSLKTYKEIWRSVYRLGEAISKCTAPSICVIYYTDFAEFRSPADPKQSRFLFTKRLSNQSLVLDCDEVSLARSQIRDTNSIMGAAIAECGQIIKQAKEKGQKISVKLVYCNIIKTDNCPAGRPLEDYWNEFFKALGIDDIEAVAERQLASEISTL